MYSEPIDPGELYDAIRTVQQQDFIILNSPEHCHDCDMIIVSSTIAGNECLCLLDNNTPSDNINECPLQLEIIPDGL